MHNMEYTVFHNFVKSLFQGVMQDNLFIKMIVIIISKVIAQTMEHAKNLKYFHTRLQNTTVNAEELIEKDGKSFNPIGDVKLEHHVGFSPDTLVDTPFGQREIKNLKIGDTVTCYDFSSKEWTTTLVIATNTSQETKSVNLKTKKGLTSCAINQEFFSPTKQNWIKATSLTSSDTIQIKDSEMVCKIDNL